MSYDQKNTAIDSTNVDLPAPSMPSTEIKRPIDINLNSTISLYLNGPLHRGQAYTKTIDRDDYDNLEPLFDAA